MAALSSVPFLRAHDEIVKAYDKLRPQFVAGVSELENLTKKINGILNYSNLSIVRNMTNSLVEEYKTILKTYWTAKQILNIFAYLLENSEYNGIRELITRKEPLKVQVEQMESLVATAGTNLNTLLLWSHPDSRFMQCFYAALSLVSRAELDRKVSNDFERIEREAIAKQFPIPLLENHL